MLLNRGIIIEDKVYEYYTKAEVSNPYTPTEVGEVAFFAKYNGYSSGICSITIIPSDTPDLPADSAPESYDFNQRILLVSHTGSGCGYCPPVKEAFKNAEENPLHFLFAFKLSDGCHVVALKRFSSVEVGKFNEKYDFFNLRAKLFEP